MGHIRLGDLPRARKWTQVVGLIEGGAGTAQVANATINAAETGLGSAAKDKGLIETIWLLTKLPLAARSEDFAQALRDCGLSVSDSPGLMEIVGAVADAIDARMPNCKGRTDLGEMAQMAAGSWATRLTPATQSSAPAHAPPACPAPPSRSASAPAPARAAPAQLPVGRKKSRRSAQRRG
jgi:hypothetical protein